jgi:ankyrin repeat protein
MASLHDAIRNSSIEEVKSLIATGHDVNQIDKLKRTPLHIAAWCGKSEVCLLLIRSNAQLTAKAQDGFTAVHFASQSSNSEGSSECIRILLKKEKSLLNMRITKGNKSALHLAVLKGNEHAITALIDMGADTKATTSSGQLAVDLAKSSLVRAKVAEAINAREAGGNQSSRTVVGKNESKEDTNAEDDVGKNESKEDTTAEETDRPNDHEKKGLNAAANESSSIHASETKKRAISEISNE